MSCVGRTCKHIAARWLYLNRILKSARTLEQAEQRTYDSTVACRGVGWQAACFDDSSMQLERGWVATGVGDSAMEGIYCGNGHAGLLWSLVVGWYCCTTAAILLHASGHGSLAALDESGIKWNARAATYGWCGLPSRWSPPVPLKI